MKIGTFTSRQAEGLAGHIRSLILNIPHITIEPNYRVFLTDEQQFEFIEVGQGWMKNTEEGESYLSRKLTDPTGSFTCALFKGTEE